MGTLCPTQILGYEGRENRGRTTKRNGCHNLRCNGLPLCYKRGGFELFWGSIDWRMKCCRTELCRLPSILYLLFSCRHAMRPPFRAGSMCDLHRRLVDVRACSKREALLAGLQGRLDDERYSGGQTVGWIPSGHYVEHPC